MKFVSLLFEHVSTYEGTWDTVIAIYDDKDHADVRAMELNESCKDPDISYHVEVWDIIQNG